MKTTITGLLGSAILLSSTTNIFAAEQDAVIVTATRTAQTVDESLASVTVITEDDIQRSQATYLQDLLQSYAGIQLTNNGGAGKTTGLHMRGTNARHVLVMIDGMKVGSATSGTPSIQDIPLEQIERIEIVRGPRSSLYGSEAIGGVIQIFTKKGTQSKTQITMSAGHGSFNTDKLTTGISHGNGTSRYSMQASYIKTDGIDVKDDGETDKDGYSNNSLNINFASKFGNSSDFAVNILNAAGKNKYDGSTVNEAEFEQQTVGIKLNLSANDSWKMAFQTGYSADNSDNMLNGAFVSRYETTMLQSSWQNDVTINANNILTFGADYRKDDVASTVNYDEKIRDNTGLFLQHQWSGQVNDLLIGLRQDDNQAFGKHTTGNIGWGLALSESYRLTASYGTGFSAPTYNQLYYPSFGNPNLKPEESSSSEIGLKAKHGWGRWDIAVYHTEIENMIAGFPAENVDKAEINGVEFRISTMLAGLRHQLDLSYTDPRDANTDKILRRHSRKALRYNLDKMTGSFQYGASIVAQGEQYDNASNTTRVSGYGLLNLHASYALTKQWLVKAKLENVADKEYETIDKYNQPGLNAYVSINYQGF